MTFWNLNPAGVLRCWKIRSASKAVYRIIEQPRLEGTLTDHLVQPFMAPHPIPSSKPPMMETLPHPWGGCSNELFFSM